MRTTFEVTAALPSESKELRKVLQALFSGAEFERMDSTCFNVYAEDPETVEALEEFLDGCENKNGLQNWRLV